MIPLYFGGAKRKLFGALDPAHGKHGKPQAAVICYPWGSEYLYAHRALRHLARLLAARGCHVLRFDYYGTGDSAGEDFEGGLAGWREDIATAIDELKESSGARSVSLIGLRLGAALAAEVAAAGSENVSALVLWDPAVSGTEHLERLDAEWRKMAQTHRTNLGDDGEDRRGGRYGLPMPDELAVEMRAFDLSKIAKKIPAKTLCLSTERLASHDSLRSEFAGHPDGPISLEEISDVQPWVEPNLENVGALPLVAIRRIVTWLVP